VVQVHIILALSESAEQGGQYELLSRFSDMLRSVWKNCGVIVVTEGRIAIEFTFGSGDGDYDG
jgi:hypothetical protein